MAGIPLRTGYLMHVLILFAAIIIALAPIAVGEEQALEDICCLYQGYQGRAALGVLPRELCMEASGRRGGTGEYMIYPAEFCALITTAPCEVPAPDIPWITVLVSFTGGEGVATCQQSGELCPLPGGGDSSEMPPASSEHRFRVDPKHSALFTLVSAAELAEVNATIAILGGDGGEPVELLERWVGAAESNTTVHGYELARTYLDAVGVFDLGCLGCLVRYGYIPGTDGGGSLQACIADEREDDPYDCITAACAEAAAAEPGISSVSPADGDLWDVTADTEMRYIGYCAPDTVADDVRLSFESVAPYQLPGQEDMLDQVDRIKCTYFNASTNLVEHIEKVVTFWEGVHQYYVDVIDNLRTIEDALAKQCASCRTAITDFLGPGSDSCGKTGEAAFCQCDGQLGYATTLDERLIASDDFGPHLCDRGAQTVCLHEDARVCPLSESVINGRDEVLARARACPICLQLPCIAGVEVFAGDDIVDSFSCNEGARNPDDKGEDYSCACACWASGFLSSFGSQDCSGMSSHRYICEPGDISEEARRDLGYGAPDGHCTRNSDRSDDCRSFDSDGSPTCHYRETDYWGGVLRLGRSTNVVVFPPKLRECRHVVTDLKDLCTVDGSEEQFGEHRGPCETRERVEKSIAELERYLTMIAGSDDGTDVVSKLRKIAIEYNATLTTNLAHANASLSALNDELTDTFRQFRPSYEEYEEDMASMVRMAHPLREDVIRPNILDMISWEGVDGGPSGETLDYETISARMDVGSWRFGPLCDELRVNYTRNVTRDSPPSCTLTRTIAMAELVTGFTNAVDRYLNPTEEKCVSDSHFDSFKPRGRCAMPVGVPAPMPVDTNLDRWGPRHVRSLSNLAALDPERDLWISFDEGCMSFKTLLPARGPGIATVDATPPAEERRSNGATCSSNGDCVSGNCMNGICCINGRVCCTGDDMCDCDQENDVCDGRMHYCLAWLEGPACGSPFKRDLRAACDDDDQCKSGLCDGDTGECCERDRECCREQDHCPEGMRCLAHAGYCLEEPEPTTVADGGDCWTDEDCTSGNCQHDVCCRPGWRCCRSDAHCDAGEGCWESNVCIDRSLLPRPGEGGYDPCPAFCRAECDIDAIGGHCHAELGLCVCHTGLRWKRTSRACPKPAIGIAPEKVAVCCESSFELVADLPRPDPSGTANTAAEDECAEDPTFTDGWVHFDRCETIESESALCCSLGVIERPVEWSCYVQGDPATCRSLCTIAYEELPTQITTCQEACERADISCERACFESIPDDEGRLACMRGSGAGAGCGGADGLLQVILTCLGNTEAAPPERIACAKMRKGTYPRLSVRATGLYTGPIARPTFYHGEEPIIKATLFNEGTLSVRARATFEVVARELCDGMECDIVDQVAVDAVVGKSTIPPGATTVVESLPVWLPREWRGLNVTARVQVHNEVSLVAEGWTSPVAVVERGRIALTEAYFGDGKTDEVYPHQLAVARVILTSDLHPLNASVYLVDASGEEVAGTRESTLFRAPIDDSTVLRSRTDFIVSPTQDRDYDSLLIGFDALDVNGELLVRSVLSSPMSCLNCTEGVVNERMAFPDAVLKVGSPALVVDSTAFMGDEGTRALGPIIYQESRVRASVTLRNAATVQFTGDVVLSVVDEEGSKVLSVLAEHGAEPIAPGGRATITTPAFTTTTGSTYGMALHARRGPVDWINERLSVIEHPKAALQVVNGTAILHERTRDYDVSYSLGSCLLRFKCTSCLTTCEFLIDQVACHLEIGEVCHPPDASCTCERA